MLPKKKRLTTAVFSRIFKASQPKYGKIFWLKSLSLPNTKTSLFAVSVSKKVAPKAVARNRIKREVYELIDHLALPHLTGLGVIVGVTKDIKGLSRNDLENELSVLLKKVSK